MCWQLEVTTKIEKYKRDRENGNRRINESAGKKDTGPIAEIVQGFGQERIDLTLTDIGGDLPFILGWGYQVRSQNGQEIVIDHRSIVISSEAAAALVEDSAPEEDSSGQRNQTKKSAQKIVPAIYERVLQSQIKNSAVSREIHLPLSSTARLIAAIMLSNRATFLPAISNAVP